MVRSLRTKRPYPGASVLGLNQGMVQIKDGQGANNSNIQQCPCGRALWEVLGYAPPPQGHSVFRL